MSTWKWLGFTVLALLLGTVLYAGLRKVTANTPQAPAADPAATPHAPAMAQLPDPAAPPPAPSIVSANNDFGFRLYAELAKTAGDKNLFISPVSAEYALAMVANGAGGATYAQMAQALGWQGMTPIEVDTGLHALAARLRSADAKVQVDPANSLWLSKTMTFRDTFLHSNTQYFGAELRTVDFTAPATVTTINDWVKTQTHGMIPSIIGPGDLNATTRLALLNALYFKGKWAEPFKTADTADHPFTLTGGATKSVKMMHRVGSFTCYEDDMLQMVKLPYGNGAMTMTIILPRAGVSLAAAAQAIFDSKGWSAYQGRLLERRGSLGLPRFKADYMANLPDALRALGMTDAFTAAADFSGISATPTYISNVRQKTALEVNEEGTKAAAATSVTMRATAVRAPQPPFVMLVDHPFLLAIQTQDNALLFLGAIANPS